MSSDIEPNDHGLSDEIIYSVFADDFAKFEHEKIEDEMDQKWRSVSDDANRLRLETTIQSDGSLMFDDTINYESFNRIKNSCKDYKLTEAELVARYFANKNRRFFK